MFLSTVFIIIPAVIIAHFSIKNVSAAHRRIDGLTKLPNDHRSYRGLELENGMKVLLISDPEAAWAAATMAVGVGSTSDPEEMPGLANFTAHMLLKGSKKFKQNFGFTQFVEKYGGSLVVPVIRMEETIFSFQIDCPNFMEALDRFANLFFRPQLAYETKLSVTDALALLEAEHKGRSQSDVYRIALVQKSVARPHHPYTRYSVGSVKWLYNKIKNMGIRFVRGTEDHLIYSKAREFYKTHYSSNIMSLVLLGEEDLDKQERFIMNSFAKVKKVDSVQRVRQSYENHPFGEDVPKYKIYIAPLSTETRSLELIFALPDFRHHFQIPFYEYVNYFLTYEGPGSLFSILRNKGLCTTLEFYYSPPIGMSLASILFTLTGNGEERIDDIINLTFQYIRMLRENGINEWMFNEITISYKRALVNGVPKCDSVNFLEIPALGMLDDFPIETLLVKDFPQNKWDESVIKNFVSYLRPDNMNVSITSQIFAEFADLKERYYGTKYGLRRIKDEMMEKWNRPDMEWVSELRLPEPNKFLPEVFDIYPPDTDEEKHPHIIYQSPISEIWFKQDVTFSQTQLQMYFELSSSVTRLGPYESTLWSLFYHSLMLSWKQSLYSPQIAGIKWVDWEVGLGDDLGMIIKLKGFAHKLPLLAEMLFTIMTNFANELNETNFREVLKEHFLDRIKEDAEKNHLAQIHWHAQYLRMEGRWGTEHTFNVARSLQVSDMKKFLRKVFRRIFIRGYIHGNCTKEGALRIVDFIEKLFPSSRGLLLQEFLLTRHIELNDGSHYVHQLTNKTNDRYAYSSYFQLNTDPSLLKNTTEVLLYNIIQNSCIQVMPEDSKTEQVICAIEQRGGMRGFAFTVVSNIKPNIVDRKLELYLNTIPDLIQLVSDDQFQLLKNATIQAYLTPDSSFEFGDRYWYDILFRMYDFDKTEREVDQISKLQKSHLLDFVKDMLDESSPYKRKFSIHIYPRNEKEIKSKDRFFKRGQAIKIKEPSDFKNSLVLLNNIFSLRDK